MVSTKPAGKTIDEHQGEPGSGLVRFNASLGLRFLARRVRPGNPLTKAREESPLERQDASENE